jgi:hypothetical protein
MLTFTMLAAPAAAEPLVPRDAAAPDLALDSDPEPPDYVLGVSVDALGLALGTYQAHVEGVLAGAHGLWLASGWLDRAQARGVSLEVGYHLWPLGRGLSGPFAGPLAGLVLQRGSGGVAQVTAGGELGYQHVAGGLLAGAAVGGAARWSFAEGTGRDRDWRLRVSLGWAFLGPGG